MSAPIKVSVVVAVQHAQDNLPQIMAALAPSRHPGVEILVCHTDANPDVARRIVSSDNVTVIAGARASLVPHLWRDGIRAARGPAVALITAHCIPDADWIGRLLAADLNVARSRRWLLLAASPALGAVFLAKILARTARWPGRRLSLAKALPWLVIFVIGWIIGEARGYADSVGRLPTRPERSWT